MTAPVGDADLLGLAQGDEGHVTEIAAGGSGNVSRLLRGFWIGGGEETGFRVVGWGALG